SVRGLLSEHVRLLKRSPLVLPEESADRAAMTRRTRREVADLLATEGYFSPRIRFDRSDDRRWVLQVEPGERTVVAGVELVFEGEVVAGLEGVAGVEGAAGGEEAAAYLEELPARRPLPVAPALAQATRDAATPGPPDALS